VIAAQLAEVGIAVEVRSFEFATVYADIKRGAFQLASMQTSDITEPDFYFMYFHSSWIPAAPKFDGFNRWRYRSPVVDRLTLEGRRELDHAQRLRIYAQVQRQVAEDLPIVPLWQRGILDRLPDSINQPIIGVAAEGEGARRRTAVLMHDVADWLIPAVDDPIPLSVHQLQLAHLAAMHAALWEPGPEFDVVP